MRVCKAAQKIQEIQNMKEPPVFACCILKANIWCWLLLSSWGQLDELDQPTSPLGNSAQDRSHLVLGYVVRKAMEVKRQFIWTYLVTQKYLLGPSLARHLSRLTVEMGAKSTHDF